MSRSLYAKLHRRFGPKPSGQERYEKTREKTVAALRRLPVLPYIEQQRNRGAPVTPNGKTVAVVGAGFAGLSAAYTLVNLRFQVTVFEANNRVAGRVWSLIDTVPGSGFVPGRIIEGGAELIGANHPLWLYFADQFGLGMTVLTSEDNYGQTGLEMPLYLNDELLTTAQAQEAYNLMTDVVEKINQDSAQISDPFQPWLTPGATPLDNTSVYDQLQTFIQEVVPDPSKRALVLELFRVQLENNQAVTLQQQSYLGLLSQVQGAGGADYWTETEVFRCENGNSSLATQFQNAIGSINVLLDTPVTAIDISNNQGTINGESSRTYDYVILAIPPCKWTDITFTPELTVGAMQMGPAIKYLAPLSTRFWIQEGLAPSGMSDALGMTWEGTDNQSVAYANGQPLDPNVVLSVFAGATAAQKAHSASNIDQYMQPLITDLYPDYTPSSVVGPKFMDWVQLVGGPSSENAVYSCPAPSQVTTIAPLLSSAFQDRLFFAGEHTCMAFFGYMEGALQSGVRAAVNIAKAEGIIFNNLTLAYSTTTPSDLNHPYYLFLQISSNGKQFGQAIPVELPTADQDRSDIGVAMSVFNNQLYFSWIGWTIGGNNYLNILQATFDPLQQTFAFANKATFWTFPQSTFPPALVVFDKRLYMAWTDTTNHINIISSKDGVTFSEQPTVIQGIASSSAPALAAFNYQLYLVWIDTSGQLTIALSSDGINFGSPTVITSVPAQSNIPLTVFNNQLYIAWIGGSPQGSTIYIMSSSNGTDFRFSSEITGSNVANVDLAVFNQQLYLIWNDTNKNVYISVSSDGSTFTTPVQLPQITSQIPPVLAAFQFEPYI